jgi:YD repeat-containing protein
LATGNTDITQTDISVPGLGGGLVLTRTWNSRLPAIQNAFSGMFGLNWRSNYEERLVFSSPDGYLKFAQGGGAVWSFGTAVVGGSFLTYRTAAPANDATTIGTGDTYYTLVAKSGEKKTFDNISGALLSIADRNGNTTTLTYDSTNRLITVADAAGRHLNFSYLSPTSPLVSTVTSDVGITLSYQYDPQGRLTLVTKPDNTTVSFEYDAQSRITAVRDADGKLLESHGYDALGRGLTSSRANGVDSLTVTYPQ